MLDIENRLEYLEANLNQQGGEAMSRLGRRVGRLWRATHTFVTAQDWKLFADDWKARLDDGGVKSEDFKAECAELRLKLSKIDPVDVDKFEMTIKDFAKNNYLAYCAFLHEDAVKLSKSRGSWARNDFKGFMKKLHDVRSRAKEKRK